MSAPTRLLIFGGGHLGRQTLTHLTNYFPRHEIAGFIDDTLEPGAVVSRDLRCLGGLEAVASSGEFPPGAVEIVFAIGYADMKARRGALDRVLAHGYRLFSVVHPRAIIEPTADVATGCIVLAGAIIDQGAVVETGCYVDIGVRIGEDAVLGTCSYASSGAALGGSVRVGEDCFLGMDCTLTTGVSIGRGCFINAKSLVSRNLGDGIKFVEMHRARELPAS